METRIFNCYYTIPVESKFRHLETPENPEGKRTNNINKYTTIITHTLKDAIELLLIKCPDATIYNIHHEGSKDLLIDIRIIQHEYIE